MRESHAVYIARYRKKHPKRRLIENAKWRAKENGLLVTVTEDDFDIPEQCPILGIKLKAGKGKCCPTSPSLDRIDNSKGYIPGNVQVISYRANAIKNNATPEELMKVARYMRSHHAT